MITGRPHASEPVVDILLQRPRLPLDPIEMWTTIAWAYVFAGVTLAWRREDAYTAFYTEGTDDDSWVEKGLWLYRLASIAAYVALLGGLLGVIYFRSRERIRYNWAHGQRTVVVVTVLCTGFFCFFIIETIAVMYRGGDGGGGRAREPPMICLSLFCGR